MFDIFNDNDKINGELIDCFPHVFFNNTIFQEGKQDGLCLNGHNRIHYQTGDNIPWRTFVYNYTENFLIIGTIPLHAPDDEYGLVVHRIISGTLEGTYYLKHDDMSRDFFLPDMKVINAYGDFLNIHSMKELHGFYKDYGALETKGEELRELRASLPDYENEWSELYFGRPNNENSPEFQECKKRMDELEKKITEQEKISEAILDPLRDAFYGWTLPEDHTQERVLGGFLMAAALPLLRNNTAWAKENRGGFQKSFQKWYSSVDRNIINSFCTWYGENAVDKEKVSQWVEKISGSEPWDGRAWDENEEIKDEVKDNESLDEGQER